MKILIVNDDGIAAEGLRCVVDWARRFAEVTVVAPKFQQSGKSQSIDIHGSYEVKKVDIFDGIDAYSVDSTPADCTRIALLAFGLKPDLVISGINRGFNIGGDIVYSGTVGSVFQAARLGYKGMAISADMNSFDSAVKHLDFVYKYITDGKIFGEADVINVNIPDTVNGILVTHQGKPLYEDAFEHDENGIYRPVLQFVYKPDDDLAADCNAVMQGYISVSPLTIDRTDRRAYEALRAR